MFFAYIIQSETDQTYYYGHSKNLEERLRSHNQGKVRSTKAKRPWNLHYHEVFKSKSEACKREQFFKSIEGYRWLKEQRIT